MTLRQAKYAIKKGLKSKESAVIFIGDRHYFAYEFETVRGLIVLDEGKHKTCPVYIDPAAITEISS